MANAEIYSMPFVDFSSASREVLRFLEHACNFGAWMVTRTERDDWIVLDVEGHDYGIKPGKLMRWSDSFCMHMVAGTGPNVAPDAMQVPVYRDAPIAQAIPIRSYIGVPLRHADGSLFGTLCAIDAQPKPAAIKEALPQITLLARLLSTVLEQDLNVQAALRRAERAEAESLQDALTGLYNRRGWEQLLAVEEKRCQRFGHPAGVIMLDLDRLKETNDREGHRAGDTLLQRTARLLDDECRTPDVVARYGGDEFTVLALELDAQDLATVARRLHRAFTEAGIAISIGHAIRQPERGLQHALQQADLRMLEHKHTLRN